MIGDLLRSVIACAMLLLGGMGFVLVIRPTPILDPALLFGLGWNIGLLSLYLAGNVFIRISPPHTNWAWWVGGSCLAAALFALSRRETRPKWEASRGSLSTRSARIPIILCLAFLCFKAILAFGILSRMPIIDSDAAESHRWVGLAKEVAFRNAISAFAAQSIERFSPSLIPAYVAGFLSRWRDNLVCIPWLITWTSVLALAWGTIKTCTGNSVRGATTAFLFAAVPLSIVHSVRPGFSDLLVSGFLMSAVSVFLLTMYRREDFTLRPWILLLLLLLGAVLTKKEGIIWSTWMLVAALCFYLNRRRTISWIRIATGLVLAGGVTALSYVLLHDWMRNSITDKRVRWLFEFGYSDRAVSAFFKTLLASNGFNLLYWILFGLSIGLLFKVRKAGERALLVFVLLPFIFLFYFCCFTGNLPYTESVANTGRLLLQIQAFALPVFLIAWDVYDVYDDPEKIRAAEETDPALRHSRRQPGSTVTKQPKRDGLAQR